MTPDDARDLFSQAYDGELTGDQQRAFDALLEGDEGLRREFEGFRAMMQQTRSLGSDELDAAPPPEFVASVQDRIRRRSRGRYYRDRFATSSGPAAMMPLMLGLVVMLTLGIAYFVLNYIQLEPAASTQHE